MTLREADRWQSLRQVGKWRFARRFAARYFLVPGVLINAAALWLSRGLMNEVSPDSSFWPFIAVAVVSSVLLFPALGVACAILLWHFNEYRFRASSVQDGQQT